MNLSWFDAGLLTLLFGFGSVIAQSLSRRWAREGQGTPLAACGRHDWYRDKSRGLVCRQCGKIPG